MRHRSIHLTLVLALASAPAAAAETAVPVAPAERPRAIDVELRPEGVLLGQLVSASGAPRGDARVKLTTPDGREALAKTNDEGAFAFRGVRGVATLQTDKSLAVVRGWAPGAAPPSATPAVLMVEQDGVARGQHYVGSGTQTFFDRSKRLFANPLFVAGVVGTAVAIPVAIANDDDDPAS